MEFTFRKNGNRAMTMTLPDDLAECLRALGLRAVATNHVSTRPDNLGRICLRVTLEDGTIIKARWLATQEHATKWNQLREIVGRQPFLADRLDHQGTLVLEEWVAGETLPMANVVAEDLRQAGAVLARIHRMPIPGADVASTEFVLRKITDELGQLVADGGLARDQAEELQRIVRESAPRTTRKGFIHYDFCGENLVRNHTRGIVSIDHEWACLHSLEYDLARAIFRWNLTGRSRTTFVESYWAAGGLASGEALDWWLLANEVFASALRWRRGWTDAAATVQRLLLRLSTKSGQTDSVPTDSRSTDSEESGAGQ